MEKMWAFVCGPRDDSLTGITTVEIENFGKIQHARIELRDFLVLVGKNNTGKSYLAYLIWAIRSGRLGLSRRRKLTLNAPKWFRNQFDAFVQSDERAMEIDGAKVCNSYNRWLSQKKNELIADILNVEEFEIGKIKFHFSQNLWLHRPNKVPEWISEIKSKDWQFETWAFSWTKDWDGEEEVRSMLRPPMDEDIVDAVYRMVVEKLVSGRIEAMWDSATYLPAARTGLVLAINELASSALKGLQRGGVASSGEGSRFTAPMSEFLSDLVATARRQRSGARFSEIADFLEENILRGQILIEGKGVPEFQYRSSGSDKKFPMHVVSSMITELTPILALMRYSSMGSGLVLEEPEAHLHLEAQRIMARALVRLVNAGLPVTLTTHSDTFLQQLNILIRAQNSRGDSKLGAHGYETVDLLDSKKAMVYEFIGDRLHTSVEPAPLGVNGFVVKSINETLFSLAREALDFRTLSDE